MHPQNNSLGTRHQSLSMYNSTRKFTFIMTNVWLSPAPSLPSNFSQITRLKRQTGIQETFWRTPVQVKWNLWCLKKPAEGSECEWPVNVRVLFVGNTLREFLQIRSLLWNGHVPVRPHWMFEGNRIKSMLHIEKLLWPQVRTKPTLRLKSCCVFHTKHFIPPKHPNFSNRNKWVIN